MSSEPIWKRLGYATRNQYRNAQSREHINPSTGLPFTSYRQERDYRARLNDRPRDYVRERERANLRAQERGFPTASRERSVRTAVQKWGVTYSQFQRMRRLNREHWDDVQKLKKSDFPTAYHRYRENPDKKPSDYVGYVISYYHAIVDDEHNWNSVLNSNGVWEKSVEQTSGGYALVPKSDKWWRVYLVQYGDLVSEDFYDARYGII